MNMLLGRTDLIGRTGHNMFKTYVIGALLVGGGGGWEIREEGVSRKIYGRDCQHCHNNR